MGTIHIHLESNNWQVIGDAGFDADLRAADPFGIDGGKLCSKADRSRFLEALEREVRAGWWE